MVGLDKREGQILALLQDGEEHSVARLSELLGVSAVTIRADLKSLELKGMVIRSRGTAIPAFHPQLMEKQGRNTAEKEAIARLAATFVSDGDSIMISNGTTCALIARYLFGKRDIQIVTNSTLVLPYVRVNGNISLTLVGGEFRPQAEALVGPSAVKQIEDYHVSTAFFGTDGLTLEYGLTTALVENADILRRMCSQAGRRILTVDSSKLGNKGFVRILPLTDVDILITDSGMPEETIRDIREMGVDVRIAR
ncbi:DeoR/GlpR family DNA-binding transcription regulator [Parasphaerochaeta coccoides]|uniref:Transcriptional regulator, DeoR family n=1 Tax=Parasphaerochaeta coccoides (strain ATCC BAA-1237 / DSM 17374 / SPN1) TaxID=760011 RepID=F4GKG9_PARC1|nr:DeoR/GlpR family DNA-binding transcription regulator [Parasphaerochaeta coccoides]AEC02852.1 transcriptional regulator, DeoR family [Parasphaerochaeta coccoides DSM 17374]